MARELVVADDERGSMAWEDVAEGSAAMTGWRCGREVAPGLETGAGISGGRGLTTHCIKSFYYVGYSCLRRLSTEQQVAYSTSNGISTSGTCKFARDGPSYAIRVPSNMSKDSCGNRWPVLAFLEFIAMKHRDPLRKFSIK
ncbi:hypothetical protein BU17DRAFT_60064 [Hysterangium stoloniferum]|nr:hypothetical protein BU17DRAFT_60064 [Hysterangium stoloniferum]